MTHDPATPVCRAEISGRDYDGTLATFGICGAPATISLAFDEYDPDERTWSKETLLVCAQHADEQLADVPPWIDNVRSTPIPVPEHVLHTQLRSILDERRAAAAMPPASAGILAYLDWCAR